MISAIILTKNEEAMISQCINSCKQIADQIIVVDNGSNDRTVEIAQQKGATVQLSNEPSFAKRRDLGLAQATGDWVLYVDADERVTPEMAQEIRSLINDSSAHAAYIINRKDYYFGEPRPLFSPMHRFFKRSQLKGWHGDLHETPNFEGTVGTLHSYFLHFTHIDLNSMLINTISWSDREAKLRLQANHPPVVWWRFIRVFITGFWDSYVTKQGYKCGTAGWVEALYQGCSLFITYAKLWEMQNKDRIKKNYADLDQPYLN